MVRKSVITFRTKNLIEFVLRFSPRLTKHQDMKRVCGRLVVRLANAKVREVVVRKERAVLNIVEGHGGCADKMLEKS